MEKLYKIHEGDNIGSFYKAEIAHIQDFLNFSDQEILFRENKDWRELEITDETGELSFSEAESEHGEIIRYQGVFSLHGPILAISKIMRPYLGRKSILKLTSLNNEVFLLGDQFNPVTISSNAGTGKKYTDRSQIDYSFAVETPLKCIGS